MTAWYRNTDWNDEIAADFEKRLARSRHQKAQNLSLQGYALIPPHPEVARDLLQRAVGLDDASETPRALAFLATAHLALGEVGDALSAYEAALERQVAEPNIIAVQPVDYVFLVGVFSRIDRLPVALPIADALPDEGMFGPDAQVHAAKALVFEMAGRHGDAFRQASLAQPLLADLPEVAALGVDLGQMRRRIEAIMAEGGKDG